MKRKESNKLEIECEIGSDNVFEDLEFENPKEELLKADLTNEIAKILKEKHLTQVKAAKIIGVDQPRISSLLSGNTGLFSVAMLMHFLNALGKDIKLFIETKPRNRKHAYSSVCNSSSQRTSRTSIAAKSHK